MGMLRKEQKHLKGGKKRENRLGRTKQEWMKHLFHVVK